MSYCFFYENDQLYSNLKYKNVIYDCHITVIIVYEQPYINFPILKVQLQEVYKI